MTRSAEVDKSEKSSRKGSTGSEKELLLTIENTPEDRLDILKQLTRLKLSLQKFHAIRPNSK